LWLAVAAGALAGILLAGQGWAYWQESAARRAMAGEQFEEAQRHVDRALWLHGRWVSTNLLAARVARERGAYAEAGEYLNRCGQLGGMSGAIELEWLLLRCVRGESDELGPQLMALVDRKHPESPAILEALAGVYMRQTRYQAALRCLDRWVELEPNSVRALDWRGWVANQLDQRWQALSDYERALDLQPGRTLVRFRLAELLVESSRDADAVPHLERLQAEQPKNAEVVVLLARCRIAQSRTDEARDLLDAVIKDQPTNKDALLYRGKLEQSLGNFTEAEHWLRKALEQSAWNSDARFALYLCLQAQPDRTREAQEEMARWFQQNKGARRLVRLLRVELDRSPNDPDLAAEAGELLLQAGEDEKGLFWLHRALKVSSYRNVASHRALAAYYDRTNNPAKAAEHREKLAELGESK
jgi:tetratricopeptide (TPR) repeat protein